MTEQEFLSSDDPSRMLVFLRNPAHRILGQPCISDRKLKLWVAACWRAIPPEVPSEGWLEALRQLEEIIEGKRQVFCWTVAGYICATTGVGDLLRHLSGLWLGENHSEQQRSRNAQTCACLLREIVGNPFRLVVWHEEYMADRIQTHNGGAVIKIARVIYESQAWDMMPMLADALEEAGASNTHILDHLRGPCPHVRGCWVLDLLLGLE